MRAFVVVFALISAASAFTLQHIDEQKGEFVGDAASSLIGQETNGAIQAEPKAFEGGAGDYSSNDYSGDYNSGRDDEGFGGPSSYESFDDIGGGEGQGPFGRDGGRGAGGPSQDSRRPRQEGGADYNEGYDYYGDGQRDNEQGGAGSGGDYDYSYGDDDDSADYRPAAYEDDDDYPAQEGRSNNNEQGYPQYQQQEGDHQYPSADAAAAAYYGRNQQEDEEQGAQQSEEGGEGSQKKDGYSESDFNFADYDSEF